MTRKISNGQTMRTTSQSEPLNPISQLNDRLDLVITTNRIDLDGKTNINNHGYLKKVNNNNIRFRRGIID